MIVGANIVYLSDTGTMTATKLRIIIIWSKAMGATPYRVRLNLMLSPKSRVVVG